MPNPNIQHVFVLMLENRSFDHMLGKSGIEGIDAETGNPTRLNGVTGDVSPASAGPMNADPGHEFPDVVEQLAGPGVQFPQGGPYPPINGSGFAASFMRTAGTKAHADPGEIMKCFFPEQLPVINALAREFAVCDSWFSSMPGPTLPNRFFLLAGSSGGLDHSPSNKLMVEELTLEGFPFQHGTIFQQPLSTRIYCGGILCMAQTMKGVTFADVHRYSRFAEDVNSRTTPYGIQFTLIEPDYGDITGTFKGGTSQHPMDSVIGGERLIKEVYETIRNSPLWEKSLLVVLWDEHGGFYDHVLPPAAVPPGDTPVSASANQYGFDFSLYGPRVASVIVSPLVPRNVVDHRLYDHTSVLATAEALFGFGPLTRRDAAARNLLSITSLPAPRATPERLPEPVAAPATESVAVDKSAPADSGNVPAFLAAALRTHLSLAPVEEHSAILDRVKRMSTLAHVEEYFKEVEQKIGAEHARRAQA
jgi:phospholipase C